MNEEEFRQKTMMQLIRMSQDHKHLEEKIDCLGTIIKDHVEEQKLHLKEIGTVLHKHDIALAVSNTNSKKGLWAAVSSIIGVVGIVISKLLGL